MRTPYHRPVKQVIRTDTPKLHTGERFEIFRSRAANGQSVILKTVRPALDTRRSAELLQHEHDLLSRLHIHGIVRPLDFVALEGRPTLVIDDAGSQNLAAALNGKPLGLGAFFNLALRMVEIVGEMHAAGVLHRDVCASNFVLGQTPNDVTLIDFETATTLPALQQVSDIAQELSVTLAYCAPEQTGRMQRLVDCRADLYALGPTFYEMLTGAPPFTSIDPLELVHAHMAREPYAPTVLNPGVPQAVGAIVLKLLAKAPERRYQTAEALRLDLEEARRQWLTLGQVTPFELGSRDLPLGILLSSTLHGRGREIQELTQAIERIQAGSSELMLVSGPAGIGKSALIEAVRGGVGTSCRWLAGKGDLLGGHVAYAPLIAAVRAWLPDVLREPDPVRQGLHDAIHQQLGGNSRALLDAIPDLGVLLGACPPLADVGPVEAENRLHLAFVAFVRALTVSGPPVVLLIDDLQWVDVASLKVLRAVAADPEIRCLLLLCAYRSEDVGPDHAISSVVGTLVDDGKVVNRLEVGPLDGTSLTALLGEVLGAQPSQATDLVSVVRHKTGGNPFFVRRFLGFLYQAGLFIHDPQKGSWSWDLARITALPAMDHVVALLVRVIRALPEPTQRALETAACMGDRFELTLLAKVAGTSVHDMARTLWLPMREGLLVPALEGPRFPWLAVKPIELGAARVPTYRFAHDRIQEAAYETLTPAMRQALHLRFGRLLLSSVPEEARDITTGPIADQLNQAIELLDDDDKLSLAHLNHRAGMRARATAAYASALSYFTTGLSLLPPLPVHRDLHALWFALQRNAAECAGLAGAHALCEQLLDAGMRHAENVAEKVAFCTVATQVCATRGAHARALTWGRRGLALLGEQLPRAPTAERLKQAKQRALTCLREQGGDLPAGAPTEADTAADSTTHAKLALLSAMTSAWFMAEDVFKLNSFRAVELAAQGAKTDTSVAYGLCAIALALDGDYEAAYMCGQRGVRLAEHFGNPAQVSRALLCFAGHVYAWRGPIADVEPMLRRAASRGLEGGDIEFAAYARANVVFAQLFAGTALRDVLGEAEMTVAFYRKFGNASGAHYVVPVAQAVKCLRGLTHSPATFDDAHFDQGQFLLGGAERGLGLALFHTLRLQVSYLLGQPELARHHGAEAKVWLGYLRTLPYRANFHFYAALHLTASDATLGEAERVAARAEARAHLRCLANWARHAATNFQHKHDLVAAELARLDGRHADAHAGYGRAIEQAGREHFLQDEALAHELCARFHLSRDEPRLARLHMNAAFKGYTRWGATAKAELLKAELPQCFEAQPAYVASTPTTGLDRLSLLKAAAAFAEELVLDRLLEKMVRICLEAAAAERAVLVLDDGGLVVRATALAPQDVALETTPLAKADTLPRSVVEHVLRAPDVLVIPDALRDGRFAPDPYVVAHAVRSMLAVPIRCGQRVLGVLYFENNLMSGAFTAERADVLRLLSGHMAIALENSRLFSEIRTVADTLARDQRRLAEAQRVAHVGSFEWDIERNAVTWSDELHRIYGFEPGQFGGTFEAFLERVHPEEVTTTKNIIFDAYRQLGPFMYDHRIVRSDHSVRVLHTRGDVVTNSLGKPVRIVGTCWDITALTEATQARERAVSLLEATIEATAEGILGVDRQDHVVVANQRALDLWQIPPHLAKTGRGTALFKHIDDQMERPDPCRWQAQELTEAREAEAPVVTRLKNGRTVEQSVRPQLLGGAMVGRVWSFRDVSERERLQQQAALLVDATRLLASLDVDKALISLAERVVPELGDGCAIDLFGDGGPRRVHAVSRDPRRAFAPEIHATALHGHPVIYQVASNSYMAMPLSIKGKLAAVFTLGAAPRYTYTRDDLHFASDLANRVAPALENAALYRDAQEAVRTRDEFLAIAAHEIRGPITALHLAVQALRKGKASPVEAAEQAAKIFDVIEREERRLSRFVDALLDLGRIRGGSLPFSYEPVNLTEVVRDVATGLSLELARSGSVLSIEAADEVVGEWDRTSLDQVVYNLLANAIKFGLGRPIEVTLSAGADRAVLRVKDHGTGVDPTLQEKIFEPFERGVSVRNYGGLGVGLHIVKTVVHGFGGTVTLDSEPQRGSTFTVELPQGGHGTN